MTSRRQGFVDGKILAPAPEVDFALVLSRVIASAEENPSQLRNIVYELARIKLHEEMSRRSPPADSPGTRQLSVALEFAIERVETIHSKHDSLEAIQSLHRLADISEIKAQPTGGLLHHEHPLPSFLTRETPTRNIGPGWLPGGAPLLRGAIVAILALVLCGLLDHQFGLFGSCALKVLTLVVTKLEKIEIMASGERSGSRF